MVKRVIFGEVANEGVAKLEDVSAREFLILGALAVAVLLFGLWPAPLVEVMDETLTQLLLHVMQSKL
jgi:NADH-quinone oxidoreductase subunit M